MLGYVTGNAGLKAHYTESDDPKSLVAVDQELHRGVDLYTQRRYDDAIQAYQNIIHSRPDMAIAYRHLAFVEWETGRPREAIDVLQRAIASLGANPYVSPALERIVRRCLEKTPERRFQSASDLGFAIEALSTPSGSRLDGASVPAAQRVFERMLAIDPSSGMALANKGALALERGDIAGARVHFERATAADPTCRRRTRASVLSRRSPTAMRR